jgi:putative membrane protein
MPKSRAVTYLLAAATVVAMFDAVGARASGNARLTGETAVRLGAADRKGIVDMAIANMAEIENGKLALSKSRNPDVKTFARQMVDNHGKALVEVQALAHIKGVRLPTAPDAGHEAMAARLDGLSGNAFDNAYLKHAGVADHQANLARLKSISKVASDPDVKATAEKAMSTVEQHLKAARQMSRPKPGTVSGK